MPRTWDAPYKLTKPRMKAIADAIEAGATRELAAQAGKISRRTLTYWLANARADPDHGAVPLLEMIEASEARYAAKLIKIIEDQAPNDWRAAEAILKRRFADQYAERTEVSGPTGGPVELKLAFDPTPDPTKGGEL